LSGVVHHELIGTVLDGRYRIECVAGEGGFGLVYRASHLAFDAPVAVKLLKLKGDRDVRDSSIAGFMLEGRLLFRLSQLHPAFVQAKEAGTLMTKCGDPVPYLVMEWLAGIPLTHELKQRRNLRLRPFSLDEAVSLLDWPAAALGVAHRRGIAHRDVKPGNLFLTEHEGSLRTRILDFGLAQTSEESPTGRSCASQRSRQRPFTPAYAAPEQWDVRLGATGAWTDVHAWALVLVELVTGHAAIAGSDHLELMRVCLSPHRPTPNARGAGLPVAVDAVFQRALALDPTRRYRDVPSFWQDLRNAAEVTARPVATSILNGWIPNSDAAAPRPLTRSTGVTTSFTAMSTAHPIPASPRVPRVPRFARTAILLSLLLASLAVPVVRITRSSRDAETPARALESRSSIEPDSVPTHSLREAYQTEPGEPAPPKAPVAARPTATTPAPPARRRLPPRASRSAVAEYPKPTPVLAAPATGFEAAAIAEPSAQTASPVVTTEFLQLDELSTRY
jgi:serine/threonine protein kinase